MLCFSTRCICTYAWTSNVFVNISLLGITHFQLTTSMLIQSVGSIKWIHMHISFATVEQNMYMYTFILNESQKGASLRIAFVCELKMSAQNEPEVQALTLTMPHTHIVCTLYTLHTVKPYRRYMSCPAFLAVLASVFISYNQNAKCMPKVACLVHCPDCMKWFLLFSFDAFV